MTPYSEEVKINSVLFMHVFFPYLIGLFLSTYVLIGRINNSGFLSKAAK